MGKPVLSSRSSSCVALLLVLAAPTTSTLGFPPIQTNSATVYYSYYGLMAFAMISLAMGYVRSAKSKATKGSSQTAVGDAREQDEGDKRRTSVSSQVSAVCPEGVASDTSLLKKHSVNVSITADDITYPSVRIFHRLHPKAAKFDRSLPLLVFIHGLGGQMSQFQFLLEYFVHISHILAIDLPGCGGSRFQPHDWKAYTSESLARLVSIIVEQHLQEGQKVILIGHSMGCSLAGHLVTEGGLLARQCEAVVAICPKAEMTDAERKKLATAVNLGDFGFDVFRMFDRWGGTESRSVTRSVGVQASLQVKQMQLAFNKESRTPVWRRMASGLRLPTRKQWTNVQVPIYLVGATQDAVCPVSELERLYSWLTDRELHASDGVSDETAVNRNNAIKRCIIPNAGHGVLYESHHVVNKLVNEFLSYHVDEALNLAWQLHFLKEDKWMLKNLEKWTRVQCISPRIGRSPFRAMKTLRQSDEEHSPKFFTAKYPDVAHIIDISHEQPPYDPESFGPKLRYHKYATVSKIPPTPAEVAGFIALVESIRNLPDDREEHERLIACHCHYGFNRTGFFLCCYMIEKLGYEVPEALAAFKEARPPGIRHPHFIAELFERYNCPGLRRPSLG